MEAEVAQDAALLDEAEVDALILELPLLLLAELAAPDVLELQVHVGHEHFVQV